MKKSGVLAPLFINNPPKASSDMRMTNATAMPL